MRSRDQLAFFSAAISRSTTLPLLTVLYFAPRAPANSMERAAAVEAVDRVGQDVQEQTATVLAVGENINASGFLHFQRG